MIHRGTKDMTEISIALGCDRSDPQALRVSRHVRRIIVRCSVAVKVPNLVSHTRQTPPTRGKGSRYGHGYEYPTPYPYPPNPSAKNHGVTRTRAFPYHRVVSLPSHR